MGKKQRLQTVTNFQDTERDVFKRMEFKDQSIALFDMLRYVRAEIASTKRAIMDLQTDLLAYRNQREEKEQGTTEKIENVLSKRFDFWKWFIDKVMPTIATIIIMALLYLAFQKP
jgi:hypothetical protein